jgi:hypothetical protein
VFILCAGEVLEPESVSLANIVGEQSVVSLSMRIAVPTEARSQSRFRSGTRGRPASEPAGLFAEENEPRLRDRSEDQLVSGCVERLRNTPLSEWGEHTVNGI